MPRVVVVVPCFNEALRLDGEPFIAFARSSGVAFHFVDDGSTDETATKLAKIASALPTHLSFESLPKNVGKGEAVRAGMQRALAFDAEYTGYIDSDLATAPPEIARLLHMLESSGYDAAIGSRVRMLGKDIRRDPFRHYLGRIFATAASLTLDAPVYDTQCGAKLFRVNARFRESLEFPFQSRWAFDVELLGRLLKSGGSTPPFEIVEVPVAAWHDIAGSKVTATATVRTGVDLAKIWWTLRKRR